MNRITSFVSPDGTDTYEYDTTHQLTQVTDDGVVRENYGYDLNGNRNTNGFTVNTNNRLASDGTYDYVYTLDGQILNRISKADGDDYTFYGYDHRGRLTVVVELEDGVPFKRTWFHYDAFDRRMVKEIDNGANGIDAAEWYAYDGDHVAMLFNNAGILTHRYLHGPQIDQVLADDVVGNQVRWATTDNQGTVRDVVDNSGTILNHMQYNGFGKRTAETNAAVDFLFGYAGRELDEETKLNYYRARYYDSAVGRFISEDPIGFVPGDANLNRYVGNNATNAIDPSGLEEQTVQGPFGPRWNAQTGTAEVYFILDYGPTAINYFQVWPFGPYTPSSSTIKTFPIAGLKQNEATPNGLKNYAAKPGGHAILAAVNLQIARATGVRDALTIARNNASTTAEGLLTSAAGGTIASVAQLRDFASARTVMRSAQCNSEGEARTIARTVLGRNPVKAGDNKLRSADGRWQYRAKPVDTKSNHVHIERLDPQTGEVLENWHLYYPASTAR